MFFRPDIRFYPKVKHTFSHSLLSGLLIINELLTNSSDRFTKVEFRIYEFFNELGLLGFLFQWANCNIFCQITSNKFKLRWSHDFFFQNWFKQEISYLLANIFALTIRPLLTSCVIHLQVNLLKKVVIPHLTSRSHRPSIFFVGLR